jgi:hypothetical protein
MRDGPLCPSHAEVSPVKSQSHGLSNIMQVSQATPDPLAYLHGVLFDAKECAHKQYMICCSLSLYPSLRHLMFVAAFGALARDGPPVGDPPRGVFHMLVLQHRGVACQQPAVRATRAAHSVERAAAAPERVGPLLVGGISVGHPAITYQDPVGELRRGVHEALHIASRLHGARGALQSKDARGVAYPPGRGRHPADRGGSSPSPPRLEAATRHCTSERGQRCRCPRRTFRAGAPARSGFAGGHRPRWSSCRRRADHPRTVAGMAAPPKPYPLVRPLLRR